MNDAIAGLGSLKQTFGKDAGDIIDTVTPQADSRVQNMQTLKVYIEGSQGRWEAICIDFDIAVQGQTLDGVMESMKEAIAMYVERAHELPEKEQTAFLRRRAPWSVRFGFVVHAVAASLRARSAPSDKTRAEFLIPCPA